jgi:hypothetical protein
MMRILLDDSLSTAGDDEGDEEKVEFLYDMLRRIITPVNKNQEC